MCVFLYVSHLGLVLGFCDMSPSGFTFFKYSHTLRHRHTSLGALVVNTTCADLALGSTGAAELGELSFISSFDASLMFSGYKMGYAYDSSRLNNDPRGVSSRGIITNFGWLILRSPDRALQTHAQVMGSACAMFACDTTI